MPPNEGLSLILARPKSGVMPEILPHCERPNNPKLLDQALLDCAPKSKKGTMRRVKRWEIIADNLSKAGWSWGYVSAIDSEGRTIFVADAHRDDGKRFVVRADELLTAFADSNRRFVVAELP
jgi:hypothetical protein